MDRKEKKSESEIRDYIGNFFFKEMVWPERRQGRPGEATLSELQRGQIRKSL